jgi:hypothetical protein
MEDGAAVALSQAATHPVSPNSLRGVELPITYRIRDWDRLFENAASRKLKRLDWVAVPNKTDGEGYMELVDHPAGAAHLGAWYAIVECASKQKVRGHLPSGISQDVGGICRAIGKISQLPPEVFEAVIPRLLKIGWLEQCQENQSVIESAISLGKSADVPAENQVHREGNGITGNGKEEKHVAIATEPFSLLPTDRGSPVRSVIPAGPTFEDWWKVWWNKTAKAEAQKAWPQIAKRYGVEFLIQQCIADRKRFEGTPSWEWRANLHPGTWLRGRRWEDQLPPEVAPRPANGSRPASTGERVLAKMAQRIANGENPL